MIFNINNFAPLPNLWNGTYNGMPVEQGVYAYIVEYTVESLGQLVKSGDVTVIR